jgi:DNA topoisomerase-1
MGEGKPKTYTLVICEKPDAARRVSEALASDRCIQTLVHGITVYSCRHGSQDLVVCSALGHVYSISDPFAERVVYPVLDVEWFSRELTEKNNRDANRRIAAIRELSQDADHIVNACDYDVEGETIGFNILRYACGGREKEALRAKFSTLTDQEINEAFDSARPTPEGLAQAGRARHVVDFLWGVNLSRVLSRSSVSSMHWFTVVSMGRVQGPTLKFLADREREINWFVPLPYWKVSGKFDNDGENFTASYFRDKLETEAAAEKVKVECTGHEGRVYSSRRSDIKVPPPPPFNTGDLQREAFHAFGLAPARTLRIVENLYLHALISYPRTESQKLPASINFRKVLLGLQRQSSYSKQVAELLGREPRPAEGTKSDSAHPAIYPTGEQPRKTLDRFPAGVYDLIVRRFLSAMAPYAKRERHAIQIDVAGHEFRVDGYRTTFPGWLSYYAKYQMLKETEVPLLVPGDRLKVIQIEIAEKFDERPSRYNMGTLLGKMENEGIGTKATRADIISTLFDRGYVSGGAMTLTELGFSVVETMETYASPIVTTELTREIEDRLVAVEEGRLDEREMLRDTIRTVSRQIEGLSGSEEKIGRRIGKVPRSGIVIDLGICPVCKDGRLVIVRSRRTRKRFVGCSNYSRGCRASAPLPQRGELRVSKPCPRCKWPKVALIRSRSPWTFCVNPDCPSKEDNR